MGSGLKVADWACRCMLKMSFLVRMMSFHTHEADGLLFDIPFRRYNNRWLSAFQIVEMLTRLTPAVHYCHISRKAPPLGPVKYSTAKTSLASNRRCGRMLWKRMPMWIPPSHAGCYGALPRDRGPQLPTRKRSGLGRLVASRSPKACSTGRHLVSLPTIEAAQTIGILGDICTHPAIPAR